MQKIAFHFVSERYHPVGIFSGTILAAGGSGANFGGAGTIYFQTNNGLSLLIIDNGGHRGTNTPLASANNYLLRNGATAFETVIPTINNLLIASNAWLIPGPVISAGTVSLTVNGNATIQPGGGILADSYGSLQNLGTGHGGKPRCAAHTKERSNRR